MVLERIFGKISQAPTNPVHQKTNEHFDVASLYEGPLKDPAQTSPGTIALDEKLRQAYFWIVNTAIISPHYDIEYNDGPNSSYTFGDFKRVVSLPSAQSYSSFVLLPLLTFATRRKCLFVGGPGRGKTASAILMGILAGYPLKEVRRAMQHGHPQMTVADLLGNPLPSDLITAKKLEDITISWRSWLKMRVKIIDEYNRIPTRTQSALLTVMGDNYAEILDQVFECPDSAWFLTANDDAGGGTYQVIEALKDRIDVVVKALAFNSRFLGDLLVRVEQGVRPEEMVPRQIIFNEEEISQMTKEIMAINLEESVRRRIEFFVSHFEFCEPAARQLEYMTKDTVRLAGADVKTVLAADNGKDASKDLGAQTKNGLSVRNLMTLLTYAKAMAYFRGQNQVSLEDVRQVLPFVLQDKLAQLSDSAIFDMAGWEALRTDQVSWLRKLFDSACDEYERLNLDKEDPLTEIINKFSTGLEGVLEKDARAELVKIERILSQWSKGQKLYGHIYEDISKLKYLHQRYTNYLRWLTSVN